MTRGDSLAWRSFARSDWQLRVERTRTPTGSAQATLRIEDSAGGVELSVEEHQLGRGPGRRTATHSSTAAGGFRGVLALRCGNRPTEVTHAGGRQLHLSLPRGCAGHNLPPP